MNSYVHLEHFNTNQRLDDNVSNVNGLNRSDFLLLEILSLEIQKVIQLLAKCCSKLLLISCTNFQPR